MSGTEGAAAVAVAERSSGADPKGGINLRIEAGTQRLIDDAAVILAKTRAEFMMESARLRPSTCCLTHGCSDWTPSATTSSWTSTTIRLLLRRVPAWRE